MPAEVEIFCDAEYLVWSDEKGNLWGVGRSLGEELGTDGETVAFFERPTNASLTWHGYPVGGSTGRPFRGRPRDAVVESWQAEKRISYADASRLLRNKALANG